MFVKDWAILKKTLTTQLTPHLLLDTSPYETHLDKLVILYSDQHFCGEPLYVLRTPFKEEWLYLSMLVDWARTLVFYQYSLYFSSLLSIRLLSHERVEAAPLRFDQRKTRRHHCGAADIKPKPPPLLLQLIDVFTRSGCFVAVIGFCACADRRKGSIFVL